MFLELNTPEPHSSQCAVLSAGAAATRPDSSPAYPARLRPRHPPLVAAQHVPRCGLATCFAPPPKNAFVPSK